MSLDEFSSGFDTLLNSFAHTTQFGDATSRADIVCDEYEKSVFLTKAQEEIVLGLYNGRNPLGESFEQTEELRKYLFNLVVEKSLPLITNSSDHPIGIGNSYFFSLYPSSDNEGETPDKNIWFIIYESVKLSDAQDLDGKYVNGCHHGDSLEVYPIRHDEYHRIKNNPFRGANHRRALRLDLAEDIVEIVCVYDVASYYIRYIRKPHPIVLADFTDDGLSVNGQSEASDADNPCELHEALHQKILERAVALAYQSKAQPTQQTNK